MLQIIVLSLKRTVLEVFKENKYAKKSNIDELNVLLTSRMKRNN
jgi:hypothetical protein